MFCIILALFFVFYAADGLAKPLFSDDAVVARVSDGDSIVVRTERGKTEKVRLIGIDAPELRQKPWGREARKHLKKLLSGASVRLETDVVKRDRYGRLLAYVWTTGGRFINLEMIKDGYAVLYTIPPNVKHADMLRNAQSEARENKTGIWGKNGLKKLPRHYRKEHQR